MSIAYLLLLTSTVLVLTLCAYVIFIAQMYTGYALINEPGYFVHQYNLKMKNMVSTAYVRPIYFPQHDTFE